VGTDSHLFDARGALWDWSGIGTERLIYDRGLTRLSATSS